MARTRTLAEIMTRDVVTVFEEDNLLKVLRTLKERSFHHMPVVDGKRVVGMISQRDMLHATVAGVDTNVLSRAREARFLEQTFVRDLMRAPPISARPDESIQGAAKRMLEHNIGALAITDASDTLVGIVTQSDLVRIIATEY